MFPEAPPPIFGHSTFDLAPQFLAQTHFLLRGMSSMKSGALIELGWHQRASATAVGQQSQLSPILPSHTQPLPMGGHNTPWGSPFCSIHLYV